MSGRTFRTARAPRFAAVDCATRVSREQADQLYAAGYRTIFRYLDRVISDPDVDDRWPINLTRPELADLLDAGLYVSLVQYYSTAYESTDKGKKFSRAYGERIGNAAATNARNLGIPAGVTIWCDLEFCADATPEMISDYLDGWSSQVVVVSPGFDPGMYVGSNLGSHDTGYMTGSALYMRPRFRSYWRAASIVPQIPNRGWTAVQGLPIKLFGLELDQNMIALDHRARSDRDRFLVVSP